MDFRQFMCKIEGKPIPPSIENDDPLIVTVGVHLIHPENCLNVLDGDYEDLSYAFNWQSTPQGHTYWAARCDGLEDITSRDRDFIRAVMERGCSQQEEAAEDDYDDDF